MNNKTPEVNDRLGTSTLLCEVKKSHASGDFIQELFLEILNSPTYFPNCLSCNKKLIKEFPNYNWNIPLCEKCRILFTEELDITHSHTLTKSDSPYPAGDGLMVVKEQEDKKGCDIKLNPSSAK